MATQVQFYKITDDRTMLNKTLGAATSISCNVKEPLDTFNPTIVLNYNATQFDFNYCYIGNLGRYYFVDDKVLSSGGTMTLQLTEDVLVSYQTQVKLKSAIMDRASANPDETNNAANFYLPDGQQQCYQYTRMQTIPFKLKSNQEDDKLSYSPSRVIVQTIG